MDDKREIPNRYEDYVLRPRSSGSVLSQELTVKFHSSAHNLLETLYSQFSETDQEDFSVYTGITGIAFLYFFLGTKVDPSFFNRALAIVGGVLPSLKKCRVSFLTGDAGPLALGAVLHAVCGDKEYAGKLVTRLTETLLPQILDLTYEIPDEVLYGRAGYLYSLLFVNKYLGADTIPVKTIKEVISALLYSGKELALREHLNVPLMYKWHDTHYLGAAHGVAGILFMLLQARDYMTQSDLETFVRPTIDYLQGTHFPSGNFPSSLESNKDKLVQWCHGGPGMVDLFCLAHRVFGSERYLKTALQCGELVWRRGLLKKGYSICHGVSGNAYTFLRLYQTTQDLKHLHRAYQFGDWCTNYGKYQDHTPDRPLSLFEGISGVIYFLTDILQPEATSFPAFVL